MGPGMRNSNPDACMPDSALHFVLALTRDSPDERPSANEVKDHEFFNASEPWPDLAVPVIDWDHLERCLPMSAWRGVTLVTLRCEPRRTMDGPLEIRCANVAGEDIPVGLFDEHDELGALRAEILGVLGLQHWRMVQLLLGDRVLALAEDSTPLHVVFETADKPSWMCSSPACRKPSWNRSPGEYCSRACRDGSQSAMDC